MAKLLIIDDQVKMVRILQHYFSKINVEFTEDNTFCFDEREDGELEIRPVSRLNNNNHFLQYNGREDRVKKQMVDFLKQYGNSTEDVLVIIDVLLNSRDIVAPSVEKYFEDEEYSHKLYMELMLIRSGTRLSDCINLDKISFFIFSRSEIGCPLFAKILNEQYAGKELATGFITPPEWCQPENIAWCKNNMETVDKDGSVREEHEENALDLPVGYRNYIAGLE